MRSSTTDFAASFFVLFVAAIFYHQSQDLEGVSLLFPQMLIIFLTLGGFIVFVQGLLKRRKGNDQGDSEPVAVGRVVQISAGSIAYVGLVPVLRFYPASAIFLFGMAMLLNDASQKTCKTALAAAIFTTVLCVAVWAGFALLLGVPTPQSMFLE